MLETNEIERQLLHKTNLFFKILKFHLLSMQVSSQKGYIDCQRYWFTKNRNLTGMVDGAVNCCLLACSFYKDLLRHLLELRKRSSCTKIFVCCNYTKANIFPLKSF